MYQIFDLLIDSNIPLPELPEVCADVPAISFLLSDRRQGTEQFDWFHHWYQPNGEISFSAAMYDNEYYLRFHELADFQISNDGSYIRCYPSFDISNDVIRHLLINQVVPRALSLNGRLVLHASAVNINEKVVAFLGDSGKGKSTLAAYFHMQGNPLLTDDSLLIGQHDESFTGISCYNGTRLWSDSIEAVYEKYQDLPESPYEISKKLTIFQNNLLTDNDKLPIQAFFILNSKNQSVNSNKIILKKISGAEMITIILKNTFSLDLTDRNNVTKKFFDVGDIISSMVDVYQLDYPYDHNLLGNVYNVVINELNSVSNIEQRCK